MNVKWTTEEFEFVKANLNLTIKELALLLNKTEKSVKRKLERAGIKKSGRQTWTKHDQSILLENLTKDFSIIKEIFKHKNLYTLKQRYYAARNKFRNYIEGNIQ